MKQLLPIVDSEIGFSVAQSLDSDDIGNIKTQLARIKKSNPVIHEFIVKWTKLVKNKNMRLYCAFCGILVYKLLESQAECDEMERD